MKILVVSLLRLGDIVMATATVNGLKHKYPNAEIHILINSQFGGILPLLDKDITPHFFERDQIQRPLGAKDMSILESFLRFDEIIQELKSQNFDMTVNLTHNKLSGYILAALNVPMNLGVMARGDGSFEIGNTWFQYINDGADQSPFCGFHSIDSFHHAIGASKFERTITLNETEGGIAKAKEFLKNINGKKLVLIQASASEEKKTISPTQWERAVTSIKEQNDCEVVFLAGPGEEDSISKIAKKTKSQVFDCNLETVLSLCNLANLLITTDTSIKHIAAATKVKILEVSVGSSNLFKTGAYSKGAVILQGRASCAPCSHSTPCHQLSQICSDGLENDIPQVAQILLSNNSPQFLDFKTIAPRLRNQLCIVDFLESGDWAAIPVNETNQRSWYYSFVARAGDKLFIEGAYRSPIGEFGSESVAVNEVFKKYCDTGLRQEISLDCSRKDRLLMEASDLTNEIQSDIKRNLATIVAGDTLDPYYEKIRKLDKLLRRAGLDNCALLSQFIESDTGVLKSTFNKIRRMRDKMSQLKTRLQIELKVVRAVNLELKEVP